MLYKTLKCLIAIWSWGIIRSLSFSKRYFSLLYGLHLRQSLTSSNVHSTSVYLLKGSYIQHLLFLYLTNYFRKLTTDLCGPHRNRIETDTSKWSLLSLEKGRICPVSWTFSDGSSFVGSLAFRARYWVKSSRVPVQSRYSLHSNASNRNQHAETYALRFFFFSFEFNFNTYSGYPLV